MMLLLKQVKKRGNGPIGALQNEMMLFYRPLLNLTIY